MLCMLETIHSRTKMINYEYDDSSVLLGFLDENRTVLHFQLRLLLCHSMDSCIGRFLKRLLNT